MVRMKDPVSDLKATTIYLRGEVHKALRMEALEQGITMAELVRRLIEGHLRDLGYRLRKQTAAIRPGPKARPKERRNSRK